MNARDMARVGLLVLAGGRWAGDQVIPDSPISRAMFRPGSEANPSWCLMWWRNDQPRYMLPMQEEVFEGPFAPDAPRDTLIAFGFGDNRIYVVPSLELVVARRGRAAPEPASRFDDEFWLRLRAVLPPS